LQLEKLPLFLEEGLFCFYMGLRKQNLGGKKDKRTGGEGSQELAIEAFSDDAAVKKIFLITWK